MWEAFQAAKQWSKRPSEIYGIGSEYEAWCFDNAVSFFGNHIENELGKIKAKSDAARQRLKEARLKVLLTEPGETPKKAFADPAAWFGKNK